MPSCPKCGYQVTGSTLYCPVCGQPLPFPLLGLGLLATIPLAFCALTVAYGDLFGFQSDYSREVPRLKTLR